MRWPGGRWEANPPAEANRNRLLRFGTDDYRGREPYAGRRHVMPTPNVDGIDISHWNVITDEAQIPPYPLMSCKATEGRTAVSKTFASYWEMFGRLGAKYRGAYHWVRSDSPMRDQVANLAKRLDAVGGLQVGDFVQLDWETTPNIPNVTVAQIEEWIDLALERWGERVIVYGSDWVPNFLAWRKANPMIPIWYANYNTGDKPTGGWAECAKYDAAVWQWSSTYKVPGFLWNPDNVTDGIDVNHVFDWATLDRLCLRPGGTTPTEPVEVVPPPPIVVTPVEDDVKSTIYTVESEADPAVYVWFKVSDNDQVRQVATGGDRAELLADGAADKKVAVVEFHERLATLQPVGGLNQFAVTVLGSDAVADWKARSYRNAVGVISASIPTSAYRGSITLDPV